MNCFSCVTLYFISRQQITNPKYVISYPDIHHSTHGLITTSIGLNLRINSQYFESGVLRIKCVASISPTIFLNKETIIQQQGLQQFPDIPAPSIDSREALFLGIYHHHQNQIERQIVIAKHILIQSIFSFIRS